MPILHFTFPRSSITNSAMVKYGPDAILVGASWGALLLNLLLCPHVAGNSFCVFLSNAASRTLEDATFNKCSKIYDKWIEFDGDLMGTDIFMSRGPTWNFERWIQCIARLSTVTLPFRDFICCQGQQWGGRWNKRRENGPFIMAHGPVKTWFSRQKRNRWENKKRVFHE